MFILILCKYSVTVVKLLKHTQLFLNNNILAYQKIVEVNV